MFVRIAFALMLLLQASGLWSQGMITGQITNEQGEPLSGASVVVEGLRKGTAADANGVYRLENLPPGEYVLRFSFVGYEEVRRKTRLPEGIDKALLHVQMTEKAVEINPLVVRATRADRSTPFTFTTLNREALEANDYGQDVPFLLALTPSAVVTSDAGTGFGYTGIRIRGSDATRINVTINGIPLNDAESQGVFWVDLPDIIASTEDVQIQRGVGTSTFGAGAFGGTINLNTTRRHDQPYGSFAGALGSFDTWKATARFGTGLLAKRFTLDGRLSRITSDGYIERGSVDLKSFYLSGAWFGKNSSLRLNVFSGHEITYQAWCGVPAKWADDEELRTFNPCGTEKPGEPYENEVDDYTQTHYQLLLNHQFTPNWSLNLTAHYTRGFGFFEQYKADEGFGRYFPQAADFFVVAAGDTLTERDVVRRRWLDNHFFGNTWALHYIRNDNRLKLTWGGAWNRYLGDHFGELIWAEHLPPGIAPEQRYYFGEGNKTDLSSFLKAQYTLPFDLSLFADLQYRLVDYDITGTDNDLRDVSQNDRLRFFNPKAGLVYRPDRRREYYLSFAVGHREPNRDDYTDRSPNSPQPKPETLYDTELGFRQSWENATLEATFYFMSYRDQLVLTGEINDVGAPIKINVPDSYRRGLELAGSWRFQQRWELGGNLTLSRNKVKRFTEFIDEYDDAFNWVGQKEVQHENTDLAFSPEVVGAATLTFEALNREAGSSRHRLNLALLGKYVGKQYLDNTSNEVAALDPYFVADLQVRYRLHTGTLRNLELSFLLRNLLDARYANNGWIYRYHYPGDVSGDPSSIAGPGSERNMMGLYPQAGRHFLLGLRWDF